MQFPFSDEIKQMRKRDRILNLTAFACVLVMIIYAFSLSRALGTFLATIPVVLLTLEVLYRWKKQRDDARKTQARLDKLLKGQVRNSIYMDVVKFKNNIEEKTESFE
jgi:hypothetical protein